MRLFLATPLAAEAGFQAAADAFVDALRRAGWRGRAVAAGNRHLTYVFLGEVGEPAAEALRARLAGQAWPPALEWRLDRAGTFGPPGSPRVVWVGSRWVPPALQALWTQIAAACAAEGLGDAVAAGGKPFTPHVSLWRVDGLPRSPGLPPWPAQRVRIASVELVHSTLTPQGPRYRTLARWPLIADNSAGGPA